MAKKNISTDTSDYLTSADIKAAVEFLEKNHKWAAEWAATAVPPPPKKGRPRKDDVHQFDHLLPDEFNEPKKSPTNDLTYKFGDWFDVSPLPNPKLQKDIADIAKDPDAKIMNNLKKL